MELAKKHAGHGVSQFELSKIVLNNLKHFNLTPVGKLVLLVLIDCFNPDNGSVVFPSLEYIAEKAGIGITSTKQAINSLIKEGLIIKSKRGKIKGNYNKYLITPKVQRTAAQPPQNELNLKVQNTSFKSSKNDCFKQPENVRFMITDNHKQKKEQTCCVNSIADEQILVKYAKKMQAKNIEAYVHVLKENGAAQEIVNKYRLNEGVKRSLQKQTAQTSQVLKEYEEMKQKAEPMPQFFKDFKKTLLSYKN